MKATNNSTVQGAGKQSHHPLPPKPGLFSAHSDRRLCQRLLFLTLTLLYTLPTLAQQLDMDRLKGIQARNIGPAGMSGRVTVASAVTDDPTTMYIGTASGGVWKSTSGGIHWEPIFDNQPAASIGDIAIYQKNPNIIWVGTGEGNPRNTQNMGNGVFRSMDGGKTWEHLGLESTRVIHRIIVHPENPDIVWVGSQGDAWGESTSRGVYKTTDGGKSWDQVLYVNEKTGIADLVIDPNNPNKLMAAMWEFRRWPWYFNSGGEGSGLYVSYDGGNNWEERTHENGLPEGELGRMGLAIAPSNSNRVYAYVESKSNAIFRSEDGGITFKQVSENGDESIGNRPFYYADIYVDPKNENRLYSLHSRVTVSEDGGKNFTRFIDPNLLHGDNHAWYIHPENPDFLIVGNDGGMAISRDRGAHWHFPETLPLGQYYHVNVDMGVPYFVYGGMQDSGSWGGPSQVWRKKGIRNLYWERIGSGDGFEVVPDSTNNRYGYSMSQGGSLNRYDRETGEIRTIRPFHPEGNDLRFNWNSGIALDPVDKETIYYGSQYLLKSEDQGKTWDVISPDLTTNDPEKQQQLTTGGLTKDNSSAENFTTIISVAPSPLKQGVIWAGTDDGNIQLTQDGGENWTNVVDNIKDIPEGMWVAQIKASSYNPGEAVVVLNDYRRSNWTPYIYRTRNYGKKWERLVDEKDVMGYALSFVQDPLEPNLMFCGTEFGLYASIDAGDTWTKWTNGYPTVPTMDMVIHPREHDLVIATFGRSFWILDDIRPLRKMAGQKELLSSAGLHAFPAPDAWLAIIGENIGYRSTGHGLFAAENRPFGALITYQYNGLSEEDTVEVLIRNENGETVRHFYDNARPGVNRFSWNLERDAPRSSDKEKPTDPHAIASGGFEVLPGKYTVTLRSNGEEASTPVNVKLDPRITRSGTVLAEKEEMIQQYRDKVQEVTAMADQIRSAMETVAMIDQQLEDADDNTYKNLKAQGKQVKKTLKELMYRINPEPIQGFSRNPALLSSQLYTARRFLESILTPPTPTQEKVLARVSENINSGLAEIRSEFNAEFSAYKQAVETARFSVFKTYLEE